MVLSVIRTFLCIPIMIDTDRSIITLSVEQVTMAMPKQPWVTST